MGKPGGAFKEHLPVLLAQPKLAVVRSHLPMEVGCVQVFVEGQFLHGRGGLRDVKSEKLGFLPMRDGLHEASGGKDAMANGPDARSLDARFYRIRDPAAKNALQRLG